MWARERVATACPASLTSLRCRRAAFWPLGREVDRGTWIRAAPPTSAFCPWALQVAPQPPDGPLRARRSARRLPRASVRRPPSFSPSPRREPSRSHLIPPNQAFNSLNREQFSRGTLAAFGVAMSPIAARHLTVGVVCDGYPGAPTRQQAADVMGHTLDQQQKSYWLGRQQKSNEVGQAPSNLGMHECNTA